MNELKNKIEKLKILASKLKNDAISEHSINIDLKRFEKLLREKIQENHILSEINKFQTV